MMRKFTMLFFLLALLLALGVSACARTPEEEAARYKEDTICIDGVVYFERQGYYGYKTLCPKFNAEGTVEKCSK